MDRVVHFEIPFDDKSRAMSFYGECFGWQLMDMPEMKYVMAMSTPSDEKTLSPKDPGAINGGLFQRPKEAPNPCIYVGVASIDETLKKVQRMNGKVVTPKTPIAGMGAFARVSDTEGNIVGLFETGG